MIERYKPKLVEPEKLTEAPVFSVEEANAAASQEIAPEVQAKLTDLAKLNLLDYDQVREKAAKELGIRVSTLDELVAEGRPHVAADSLLAPVPEPWPDYR